MNLLVFLILMFEGVRELTWLSSPSFSICPDGFLAFMRIDPSLRDFRGVGDPAVGTTSNAVGDSAVGTPLFLRIACSSRDVHGVGDSAVDTTSNVVGDSAVGTPLFLRIAR